MSTPSLTSSISQSKIFQRTSSTLQDFVQSKHSYSERIEHNLGKFIYGRGLTEQDIEEQKLPLPRRDMRPQAIEEEIICYADKFYSKNEGQCEKEKTIDQIRINLKKYGENRVAIFDAWLKKFG